MDMNLDGHKVAGLVVIAVDTGGWDCFVSSYSTFYREDYIINFLSVNFNGLTISMLKQ